MAVDRRWSSGTRGQAVDQFRDALLQCGEYVVLASKLFVNLIPKALPVKNKTSHTEISIC